MTVSSAVTSNSASAFVRISSYDTMHTPMVVAQSGSCMCQQKVCEDKGMTLSSKSNGVKRRRCFAEPNRKEATKKSNIANGYDIPSRGLSRSVSQERIKLPMVKPRPVMRGKVSVSPTSGKLQWSGCWGITSADVSEPFSDDVVRSPFYFEKMSDAKESKVIDLHLKLDNQETDVIDLSLLETLKDSVFGGYFCIQNQIPVAMTVAMPANMNMGMAASMNINKKQSSLSESQLSVQNVHVPQIVNTFQVVFQKHFENDVLLRFGKMLRQNVIEILGSGENKFGKFLIEGTLNLETRDLNVARNYFPAQPRESDQVIKLKKRANEAILTVKRSQRAKKPNPRYFNEASTVRTTVADIDIPASVLSFPLTSESNVTHAEFGGRVELLRLIRLFIIAEEEEKLFLDMNKSGIYEVEKKLVKKSYVSLCEGRRDLWKAMTNLLQSAKKQGITKLRQSKLCVLICELETSVEKLEKEHGSFVGKMKSLLTTFSKSRSNSGSLFHTDDASSEAAYDSDDESDSSELGILEKVFSDVDPLSIDPSGSLPSSIATPRLMDIENVFEMEDEPDDSGMEGLTPVDDLDLEDLCDFDVDTLRDLNNLVDFVCPSKGG